MHRRLLVVALVIVAGCSGGSTGDDGAADGPPLTSTATAAELAMGVREETEFAETTRVEGRLNTTISATIQGDVELRTTRRVNVTTVSVAYARERGGPPPVFGTFSVPAVQPFERADLVKNPAEDLVAAVLAARAQRTYDVTETTERSTTETTLLGTGTTATRHAARATYEGETVPVFVTVATVRHEGDYVTATAVTPRAASASVEVEPLFGGVTHR